LHGQLAALFNVALSDKKQAHPVTDEPCFIGSMKVVAGAGLSLCRTIIMQKQLKASKNLKTH
jgi:hypothetical protein